MSRSTRARSKRRWPRPGCCSSGGTDERRALRHAGRAVGVHARPPARGRPRARRDEVARSRLRRLRLRPEDVGRDARVPTAAAAARARDLRTHRGGRRGCRGLRPRRGCRRLLRCRLRFVLSLRGGHPQLCAEMRFHGGQLPGGLAEHIVVAEQNLLPVPTGIPEAQRVLIEPLAVGVHAVSRAAGTQANAPSCSAQARSACSLRWSRARGASKCSS